MIFYNKKLLLFGFLFILFAIPLTVLITQKTQEIREHAATNTSNPQILSVEQSILDNIKQNGYDANTPGGGLWVNWRYGTNPLQTNIDGSGAFYPSGLGTSHDRLTDIRYLHNLWLYKTQNPGDTRYDSEIARYTPIVKAEFANANDQRGWLFDEEFMDIYKLSSDSFYKDSAISLVTNYSKQINLIAGIMFKTSTTHPQGYYRPTDVIEAGCALIQAGTLFNNPTWVQQGQTAVNFVFSHAYIPQYHTFGEDMDQVLTTSGSVNQNEIFYIDNFRNYVIHGNEMRMGSISQIIISLLNTYQVTHNQDFLNKATDLLDPFSLPQNTLGMWDSNQLGYYAAVTFPGISSNPSSPQNPGQATVTIGKKEAGRQVVMLWAYHLANQYTNNKYQTMEQQMLQVSLAKAYYASGHGVMYETTPDWTPLKFPNGTLADVMTTEAMGAELEGLFAAGAGNISLSTTPSPQTTNTLTPTKTAQYPNFKGLVQFTAHITATGSANPYLVGTSANYYWSELEPQKGQYNWQKIDQEIQPWVANGKQIILRVSTYGWAHWYPPYSGNGTPQWVYDLGVQHVTEVDGSVMPQVWNPLFLQNLSDFVHALAAHYDGNPHIAFIEIGVGVGGETRIDSHDSQNPNQLALWQSIGYTDQVWWQTIQQIISLYQTIFSKTPLAVMPDATFIGKTAGYTESLVLDYAVAHQLWLQDNGLSTNRTLGQQFFQVPHPEEQVAQTSQTGDSLQQDIQTALNLGANYILIFSSDITNPANKQTLQWVSSLVSTNSVPSLTPTPSGNPLSFFLTICPHGLGNCGDNVSSSSGGNTAPLHMQRPVTITFSDATNTPVTISEGSINYVSSARNFQGTIPVNNLTNGQYLITIHMDGFLTKQIPGIVTITKDQQVILPEISLVTGDINNDNQLDIQDYNILISCYGDKVNTASCPQQYKPSSTSPGADILDNDGQVDGGDYNEFLREFSLQVGQ